MRASYIWSYVHIIENVKCGDDTGCLDGHQHRPEHARDARRCKDPECESKTSVKCGKDCTGAGQTLIYNIYNIYNI